MSCKNTVLNSNSRNVVMKGLYEKDLITAYKNVGNTTIIQVSNIKDFNKRNQLLIDKIQELQPQFLSSFGSMYNTTPTELFFDKVNGSQEQFAIKNYMFERLSNFKMVDFNKLQETLDSLGKIAVQVSNGNIEIRNHKIHGFTKEEVDAIVKKYNTLSSEKQQYIKDEIRNSRNIVDKVASKLYDAYEDRLNLITDIDSNSMRIGNKNSNNIIKVKSKEVESNRELQEIKDEVANNKAKELTRKNTEDSNKRSNDYNTDGDILPSNDNWDSNSDPNITPPVTDNYTEYTNYLDALLKSVQKKKGELIKELKNPKNKNKTKTIDDLNKLITEEGKLQEYYNNAISGENEKNVETLFNELDDLSHKLDVIDSGSIKNLGDRVDFLFGFITGTKYGSNENVDYAISENPELRSKVLSLMHKYNSKLNEISNKIIEEDVTYQHNVLNNIAFKRADGKIDKDKVNDLFKVKDDINFFEKALLGVSQASTKESITPQILKSYLEKNMSHRTSEAIAYKDRLLAAIEKLEAKGITDFSFIFEKFLSGARTGNIISKYTSEYRRKLYKYFNMEVEGNDYASYYSKKIQWLKANADVIDFRKIKAFKDLYGKNYPNEFIFSDQEMEEYENNLRKQLGKVYDKEIDKVNSWIENYELTKQNYESKYEAERNNPFVFLRSYFGDSPTTAAAFNGTGGISSIFPNLNDIVFVPRKTFTEGYDFNGEEITSDTGYYNKDFDRIEQSDEMFEYWSVLEDIYSQYINPTYDISGMSFAKIQKEFLEKVSDAKGASKAGTLISKGIQAYREYFYEVGVGNKKDKGIVENYSDKTKQEIKALSSALKAKSVDELKSMAKDLGLTIPNNITPEQLVHEIASEMTLRNYSSDINKITGALIDMVALQKAREDTLPIANILLEKHKKTVGESERERKNSIEKLEHYINKVIKNEHEHARGTEQLIGKEIKTPGWIEMLLDKLGVIGWLKNKVEKNRFFYLYSDSERQLLKELQSARERGHNSNISDSFYQDGMRYELIVDEHGGTYFASYKDKHTGEDKIIDITPEQYEEAYQKNIESKIQSLGLDLNSAGIIQGILKTIIFKGLGLNPIGGIRNRMEGKNTNLIMDMTGYYWTKGNIRHAHNFLAFANMLHILPDRISPEHMGKYKQLKIFRSLVEKMRIVQDRKNPLERNIEQSKFSMEKYTNVFSWAVDNPEFKNQGSVVLAILMDTKIENNKGELVPIFDGSKFTVFEETKDGSLRLKEEFRSEENIRNWENMEVGFNEEDNNQFFLTRNKMKTAISRTQGNYDDMDTIWASRTIWGQVLMMFKKWMPEHFMQRFASGQNFDLFTGKKQMMGRYRAMWNNNPALAVTGLSSILVGLGLGAGALTVGGITGVVAFKFIHNMMGGNKGILEEANNIGGLVAFTKSILISTLNYPLELINLKTGIPTKYDGYSKLNLTEEEIGTLRSLAKEIAVKLTWLSIMLLAKSLTWDDDDDDDSDKRKLHNFLDNELNTTINTLQSWSDPGALYDDASRSSFLLYCDNVTKLLKSIMLLNGGDASKYALKVSPVPSFFTHMVSKDGDLLMPWQNDYEYDKGKTYWDGFIKEIKGRGHEKWSKKEYNKIRKEKKAEMLEQGMSEKEIKEALGTKPKGMSYVDALDYMENGGLPPQEPKKKGRPKGSKNKKKEDSAQK